MGRLLAGRVPARYRAARLRRDGRGGPAGRAWHQPDRRALAAAGEHHGADVPDRAGVDPAQRRVPAQSPWAQSLRSIIITIQLRAIGDILTPPKAPLHPTGD